MKSRLLLAGALILVAGCASQRPAPIEERGMPRGAAPIGHIVPEQPDLYTVKPGDTLYSIARTQGLDVSQLRAFNNLDENSPPVQAGQVLRLRPAPAQAAAAPAQPPEPAIEINSASSLPPLEAHSLDNGPGAAPAPGPTAGQAAAPGPGGPGAGGPEAGATAQGLASAPPSSAPGVGGPVKTEPRVYTLPYSAENLAMVQRGEGKPAAQPMPSDNAAPPPEGGKPGTQPGQSPPQDTQAALSPPGGAAKPGDGVDFIWPVVGKVIDKFEGGSKGIDIAASEGDPVEAAASGNVLYAGSGIRGYGQLLIIKHNDDFLSVYAHNNKLLVKQGEAVKQGQKIAEVGHTDADRPMLHFEIRRQGNSVDPLKYLPQQ